MLENRTVGFGPYRLEPQNGVLWRNKRRIKLTRKSFQVLCCLAQQPGQLLTKAELFRKVWPQIVVSDAALTRCIREIRRTLKEDARAPRYVETVHGQGFRFLPAITTSSPVPSSKFQVSSSDTQDLGLSTQHSLLAGREAELTTGSIV
jgi:DNA-binding winged helix-turn-helix (wHTH) protein